MSGYLKRFAFLKKLNSEKEQRLKEEPQTKITKPDKKEPNSES